MSVPSSSALRLNLLSHVHPPSRSHRGYVSRSYDWRSPDAIASALIPASSALFAEMMATCQPVLGLGCTCTSWPSSARPSLIISANSSAANLVFCMARFQCSPQTIWQVRVLQTPLLLFPYFIRYLSAAPFVAAPAFFLQPENFARKCGASVTPREQITRRGRGSDLPKAHSQGPCYCHHMNRTVDVILGLTAAVATALLLALIARDDIGMPPDMVREDALIGASIMIAAVAGITSRKVRQ
jgi:hypothetical protein